MTETQPGTTPKKRRFGGTHSQIRSALTFYKVLAYATGVMLLLVVVEMIAAYGFGSDIIAGGVNEAGETVPLGMFTKGADTGGINLSTMVLIVHGWMYVVYLFADFRLWQMMRWPFSKFIILALGGVVPLMSFIVETRTHRQVERELAEHPEAAKRY